MEQTRELRESGIGGSDAAVIMGLSSYKTPVDLYYEKIGEGTDAPETDAQHFGKVLEEVVAQEYSRRTERKVIRVNDTLRDVGVSFLMAHIDRRIVGTGKNRGLECKTAGKWWNPEEWGEEGSDEVPASYVCQVEHYYMVTGWDEFDLAALLAGNDFRIYHIARNAALIEKIREKEIEFWQKYVLARMPPPPTCPADCSRIWQIDDGETKIADDETMKMVAEFRMIKKEIKGRVEQAEKIQTAISAYMADKGYLMDNMGNKLASYKTQESNRFDSKAFAADHPDIYDEYKKASTTRVFR